ncbi:MAG: 50S ribosomal protein L9 [Elusimicrobia bacterium]|nr:50S ribosomal protein L9 [Elusimicrobiota bacterium]
MKVILKKDFLKLGRAGEVKQVKSGYARNYLIPGGIAEFASPGALRSWKTSEEKRKKRVEQETEQLKKIAGKMASITLSFARPAGEEGKMFGSVAKSDIIKALKPVDIEVHKDAVNLKASLKTFGNHEVEILLKPDISAKVKIVITAQNK